VILEKARYPVEFHEHPRDLGIKSQNNWIAVIRFEKCLGALDPPYVTVVG